jgi:hypothetical protein
LAREDRGDRVVRYETEFDEVVTQSAAMLTLVVESLTKMLRAN